MSNRMRAIVIREPGGPEVLDLVERERPVPGVGELLVRVAASGVNRADLLQRRGLYPAPAGTTQEIPGLEYAGEVVERGAGATLFQPGDRVMGILSGGGYAEYVVVHEQTAISVPKGMKLGEAAAIPEAFLTAYDALFVELNLSAGESLLIHAVGSGVGSAALQLARWSGARTLGTSRSAAKLDQARALGLEVAIEAGSDWPAQVLAATGGRGADCVLDLVGGAYLEGNLRALAPRGRQVVLGLLAGRQSTIDLALLLGKRLRLSGSTLRGRSLVEKGTLARRFESLVVPAIEAGKLSAVVDRTWPASDAAEAHRAMEQNQSFGKFVLEW